MPLELAFRYITPQTGSKAGRNVDRGQPHRTGVQKPTDLLPGRTQRILFGGAMLLDSGIGSVGA